MTARISDTLFRASLLSSSTQAGCHAFGLEFSGFIADNVGKSFADLPAALRSSMQRYGLTPTHWKIVRRAQLIERQGAKCLTVRRLGLSGGKVKCLAGVV